MTRQDLFDQFVLRYPEGDRDKLRTLATVVPLEVVTDDPHLEQGIVYIVGGLSEDAEVEAIARCLENCHRTLPANQPIVIRLSCWGGDVYLGQIVVAKINEIRRRGRQVHAHVVGYAYSAAFDILQACDWRAIEPSGTIMTHEEQLLTEDQISSSEMATMSEFSHKLEAVAFSQWAERTGRSVDYYVGQTDSKEWWMTATEALGEGLVDEILPIPPLLKSPATAPKRRRTRGRNEDTPE